MKELRDAKKFLPPNKAKDSAGLNSLLAFLNDNRVTGAVVPKGAIINAIPDVAVNKEPAPAATLESSEPTLTQHAPVSSQAATSVSLNKIAFTGRLMSGKDHISEQAGLTVFSLASPLYALQKLFFGSDDKTLPGAREFLQTAGQIGRGELSAALPLSIERASFITLVRGYASQLPENFSVAWSRYGASPDLWLDAMLLRVNKYLAENPGAKVAVTNVRFQNEYARLAAEGFTAFHVMTGAPTWTARLQKVNLSPESPECKNSSEQLAASLDANVIKTLSKAKHGPKLRCVWSDEKQQPPSGRLLTVSEFCAMFPK